MNKLLPGTNVLVKRGDMGPGAIVKVDADGVLVSLKNYGGLEVLLQPEDIETLRGAPVAQTAASPAPVSVPHRTPAASTRLPDTRPIRRDVETLRFGLVPATSLRELTVGYEEIDGWASPLLGAAASTGPVAARIAGPFGSGKTHTMSVIRQMALERSFVTARVEVDGKQITFANPQKFLGNLWKTLLAGPDAQSKTLIDLYVAAIESSHSFPDKIGTRNQWSRSNYKVVELMLASDLLDSVGEDLNSVLSCYDEVTATEVNRSLAAAGYSYTKVKRVISNTVTQRPSDFVDALATCAHVARMAGYKGLVITVDEFEVEALMSTAEWNRMFTTLMELSEFASGASGYPRAPLAIFLATIDDESEDISELLNRCIPGRASYVLQSLSRQQRMWLTEKVFQMYDRAYGAGASFDSGRALQIDRAAERETTSQDGHIRSLIKHYIASLDSRYGPSAS